MSGITLVGPCVLDGNCIQSSGYPTSNYGPNEACTATNLPTGSVEVVAFDLEGTNWWSSTACAFDFVTLNGVNYCGTSGPDGVVNVAGAMSFESDGDTQHAGFRICFSSTINPSLPPIASPPPPVPSPPPPAWTAPDPPKPPSSPCPPSPPGPPASPPSPPFQPGFCPECSQTSGTCNNLLNFWSCSVLARRNGALIQIPDGTSFVPDGCYLFQGEGTNHGSYYYRAPIGSAATCSTTRVCQCGRPLPPSSPPPSPTPPPRPPPISPPKQPPPIPPSPSPPPPSPPPGAPPAYPPPSLPPDAPPPPPFVTVGYRLQRMVPILSTIVGIAFAASFLLGWLMIKPAFTASQIAKQKMDWADSDTMEALASGPFQTSHVAAAKAAVLIKDESMQRERVLSPEFISGILHVEPARRSSHLSSQKSERATQSEHVSSEKLKSVMKNLVDANARLAQDHRTISRVFAVAFLSAPGETIRSGVALAVAANKRSYELASSDQIRSREVADLAGTQQLIVAGCLRAIRRATIMDALLSSHDGAIALRNAIFGECRVIISLPDIQSFFAVRWRGVAYDHLEQTFCAKRNDSNTNSRSFETRGHTKDIYGSMVDLFHQPSVRAAGDGDDTEPAVTQVVFNGFVSLVKLPVVAFWPPLADHPGPFFTSPRLRFYAHEVSSVVFLLLLITSELPAYRFEGLWTRDWGLMIWVLCGFISQANFVVLSGPREYLRNKLNLVEFLANLSALTGLLLSMCHRDEVVNLQLVVFGVESCYDNEGPATAKVPLAAFEVLSLSVLSRSLLITRVITLHPKFGPLLLMINKMVGDMVQWGVLVAIPVFGFAGAFHLLYKDTYDYHTENEGAGCFDPDAEFDALGSTYRFLIEVMLNTDGRFQCFRQSTHPTLGTLMSYSYVVITCIMFVNMLIALMAKTFDNVFEAQETHFLFLKARTIQEWIQYPAAPPPLNLLSAPYFIYKTCSSRLPALLNELQARRAAGSRKEAFSLHKKSAAAHTVAEYKLPREWVVSLNRGSTTQPSETLGNLIYDFVTENSQDVVREDRFKSEMMREIKNRFHAISHANNQTLVQVEMLRERLEQMSSAQELRQSDERSPTRTTRLHNVAVLKLMDLRAAGKLTDEDFLEMSSTAASDDAVLRKLLSLCDAGTLTDEDFLELRLSLSVKGESTGGRTSLKTGDVLDRAVAPDDDEPEREAAVKTQHGWLSRQVSSLSSTSESLVNTLERATGLGVVGHSHSRSVSFDLIGSSDGSEEASQVPAPQLAQAVMEEAAAQASATNEEAAAPAPAVPEVAAAEAPAMLEAATMQTPAVTEAIPAQAMPRAPQGEAALEARAMELIQNLPEEVIAQLRDVRPEVLAQLLRSKADAGGPKEVENASNGGASGCAVVASTNDDGDDDDITRV